MLDKILQIEKKYKELGETLSDPAVIQDYKKFRDLSKQRKSMEETVNLYYEWKKATDAIADAKEMLHSEHDEEMKALIKAEIEENEAKIPQFEEQMKILLLPRDPMDDKDIMLEIRGGAGGDERGHRNARGDHIHRHVRRRFHQGSDGEVASFRQDRRDEHADVGPLQQRRTRIGTLTRVGWKRKGFPAGANEAPTASLGGLPLAPDRGDDGALGLELLERLVDLLPVDAGGLLDLAGAHGLAGLLHGFDDVVLDCHS